MKHTALLLIVLTVVTFSIGQSLDSLIIEGNAKITQGYNQWDETAMKEARAYFERLIDMGEETWLVNYYIAYCDYRLTTYYFGREDKKMAGKYINDGIERLENSLKANNDFVDAHCLLSILFSNKINVSPWPWSGMIFGRKSNNAINTALKMDSNNPRVSLIKGIELYYTPERWGGSKESAKLYFEQAAKHFENEDFETPLPSWGYDEAYAWLGLLELEVGNTKTALMQFEKALQINPDNGWVKYRLLPLVTDSN